MRCKLAVVQYKAKVGGLEGNIKKVEFFIKNAKKQKSNIIVFPENFLSKPNKKSSKDYIDSRGDFKKTFSNLAKKYKIDIMAGSVLEKEKDGRVFNVAYYIDFKGKVLCRYKKINLWDSEKKEVFPGRETRVFRTKYGKIGLLICWDIIFSEMFRDLVKKGAQIILCASHWCYKDAKKGLKYDKYSEIKLVDSLCTERAFENEIIFVYCNSAGKFFFKKKRDTSIGHSQITEPFRGAIVKLKHNREKMFVYKVDTKILGEAESVYRIKKDL
jgi:predicted amidohydrolase